MNTTATPPTQTLAQRLLALADEFDRDADERYRMALNMPDSVHYLVETVRLFTAAKHQRRASSRIRQLLENTEVR